MHFLQHRKVTHYNLVGSHWNLYVRDSFSPITGILLIVNCSYFMGSKTCFYAHQFLFFFWFFLYKNIKWGPWNMFHAASRLLYSSRKVNNNSYTKKNRDSFSHNWNACIAASYVRPYKTMVLTKIITYLDYHPLATCQGNQRECCSPLKKGTHKNCTDRSIWKLIVILFFK